MLVTRLEIVRGFRCQLLSRASIDARQRKEERIRCKFGARTKQGRDGIDCWDEVDAWELQPGVNSNRGQMGVLQDGEQNMIASRMSLDGFTGITSNCISDALVLFEQERWNSLRVRRRVLLVLGSGVNHGVITGKDCLLRTAYQHVELRSEAQLDWAKMQEWNFHSSSGTF